jgi:hypothetical protein
LFFGGNALGAAACKENCNDTRVEKVWNKIALNVVCVRSIVSDGKKPHKKNVQRQADYEAFTLEAKR